MSIRAGSFLFDAENGWVIDRIQTGGVSSLKIPSSKIYEVGNFQTVATVRDIPDLSFDVDTLDVSCEIEAILTKTDPTNVAPGQEFDYRDARPIDILSPFKSTLNRYDIINGIITPFLTLNKVDMKFSLTKEAETTYSFSGDSVYYTPGVPYQETLTNTGATTYNFTYGPATLYVEEGINIYALNVTVRDSTDPSKFLRLFHGTDYTDTTNGFTLLNDTSGTYDEIHVVYGSSVAKNYPQSVNQGVSVKPAGVRGKDIDVYIGTSAATPVFTRLTGVQDWSGTWTAKLDAVKEFGNHHVVEQVFDVPDVTGTMTIQSVSTTDLWNKIRVMTNVPDGEIAGPYSSIGLPMLCKILDPNTGLTVKTVYIPDARFTTPALQGKANTSIQTKFDFESDSGLLFVYNGDPGDVYVGGTRTDEPGVAVGDLTGFQQEPITTWTEL